MLNISEISLMQLYNIYFLSHCDVIICVSDDTTKLQSIVKNLFYNQTGVNITAALRQARKILDEIRARDFSSTDAQVYEENR